MTTSYTMQVWTFLLKKQNKYNLGRTLMNFLNCCMIPIDVEYCTHMDLALLTNGAVMLNFIIVKQSQWNTYTHMMSVYMGTIIYGKS